MASIAADRNLLFGLLALQNGLIDQIQLVAGVQAWTLDKARALADHLVGRGDLDADDRSAIDALVARHVKKHGGDVERSLAAIPAGRSTAAAAVPGRVQRDRLRPQPRGVAPGHQAGQRNRGRHGETLVVDWGLAKPLGRSDPGSGERSLMPSSSSGSSETLPGSAWGRRPT